MKSVKVQYTVKAEYADTNKANISQVMADLRELAHPGIKYLGRWKDVPAFRNVYRSGSDRRGQQPAIFPVLPGPAQSQWTRSAAKRR